MIKRFLGCTALCAVLTSTAGCYHATVVTGAAPGSQTIDKPWATSLLSGLVPPEQVHTGTQCPTGVARVETRISFLNLVASSLTFGIYTPMHIKVTCAAGEENEEESRLPLVNSPQEAREALESHGGFLLDLSLANSSRALGFDDS